MAYIPKGLVLKSYLSLSSLTEDHKQGQTQIVSAVRHLFALDMYYREKGTDCDLNIADERNLFIENVRYLVNIRDEYYTTNFYTTIKPLEDCGVGSNFTSAGVVNNSKQNTTQVYDYPTRGQYPLFNVRNAILIRNISYYKNIKHYLSTETIRCAFVIWVLRNTYLSDLSLETIKRKLSSIFTNELVDNFMPKDENILSYIDGQEVVEHLYQLECSDLLSLFQSKINCNPQYNKFRPYLTAIKSKPFLLLAGISGTGKSRIVRELARACWDVDSEEYKVHKPKNFEMVQVKPNWHDSGELIGYVSRVSGKAEFVAGDFLKFVAKAWEDLETPYFLCLDEMNLAPVEQYFAEYLSVVESRKRNEEGMVVSDPIIYPQYEHERDENTGELISKEWYKNLVKELLAECPTEKSFALNKQFMSEGISLPQNLVVIGTVNMDETTFSFSRKVLDRAMTIEMNEVNLYGGLTDRHEVIGKIGNNELVGTAVEGVDVYGENKEVCDTAIGYLAKLNEILEGTPFKVAYRTRNEFLLYVVNNLPYSMDKEGNKLPQGYVIARALDEITSMKILSRIEGDDTKVKESLLDNLMDAIKDGLSEIAGEENPVESVSIAKLKEMKARLNSGYTSFWS